MNSTHVTALGARAGMPKVILPIAAVIFAFCGIGPNLLLASLALAVLLLGTALLWRPGEPPILLLIFAVQWIQISIATFQANILGIDVNRTVGFNSDVEQAVFLSQLGLLSLVIGMRLGAGRWLPKYGALARHMASANKVIAFFRLYALAFAAAAICEAFAYELPGLAQPLLAMAVIKWAFFLLLGFSTFCQRNSPKYFFLVAFALELVWGIGGFFSDFKTVFIVTILAAAAAKVRLSLASAFAIGLIFITLLFFGLVWTAVKPSYRSFVNGGQNAQIVTVGYGERMSKLAELIGSLDMQALTAASNDLVERLTYVGFFGAVLEYVPRVAPHENGALWGDAIVRPFMPRLFFPDKAIIDDSARTNKYTGLGVSGADRGTSISIGYFGEAYIDFGQIGMMAPILALGIFYGKYYRWMLTMIYSRGVLGMGLASATLLGGLFAETSITKVFGGVIVSVLVSYLLVRFIAPRFFPWLQVLPQR